jgi:hypothetical protein
MLEEKYAPPPDRADEPMVLQAAGGEDRDRIVFAGIFACDRVETAKRSLSRSSAAIW